MHMLVSFPPKISLWKSTVAITYANQHPSKEKCVNEKTRDCKMISQKHYNNYNYHYYYCYYYLLMNFNIAQEQNKKLITKTKLTYN